MRLLIVSALCFLCLAHATVLPDGVSEQRLQELADKYLSAFRAPVIQSVKRLTALDDNTPRRPVVLMHGLGDAGSNPGMASLAKSVSTAFPGTYAIAVDVADGLNSFFTLMADQVDQFAALVRADANLANGFNVVGLSQGGLVIRGYIERYNNPPVYNAISICGPQNGVGTCPAGTPGFVCDIFKLGPYTAKLSFAGYWKEVDNESQYLAQSSFLADINNERPAKNVTYHDRMASLNKYVLVMALQDTVVQPKESEQHGFWKWNDTTHSQVETLFDTEAFKGDWIGLNTLYKTNRLDLSNFTGEHIRFSNEYWQTVILPYFDNAPSQGDDNDALPVNAIAEQEPEQEEEEEEEQQEQEQEAGDGEQQVGDSTVENEMPAEPALSDEAVEPEGDGEQIEDIAEQVGTTVSISIV